MMLRWLGIFCLTCLGLLSTVQAGAASDADVIRQFGMLGRLAIDCSAPYSERNPHLIITASADGQVTRELKMAPDFDGLVPMRNLRMVGPGTMQYDETDRGSAYRVSIAKQTDGRFRSWRSVRMNGANEGEVLIADGRHVNGPDTIAFTFCGP